jgi:hypothetical protein
MLNEIRMSKDRINLEQAQQRFRDSSVILVAKSEEFVWRHLPLKVQGMQRVYLNGNTKNYSLEERERIEYFLDATLLKFKFASYSLEQLWAMRDAKVNTNLLAILEKSVDSLDLSTEEQFLQSFTLEQFLFQGRAFLDFAMIYIALLLKTGHQGSMSRKTFYRCLDKAQSSDKAILVKSYFDNNVFSENREVEILSPTNWGILLKSLRDKIAHRDIIRPSSNSKEKIANQILLEWPTLKDLLYDRFCQSMQNGMFWFFQQLTPILYDLEWESGPYREGMWKEKK